MLLNAERALPVHAAARDETHGARRVEDGARPTGLV